MRLFLFFVPVIVFIVGLVNLIAGSDRLGHLINSANVTGSVAKQIESSLNSTGGKGSWALVITGIFAVDLGGPQPHPSARRLLGRRVADGRGGREGDREDGGHGDEPPVRGHHRELRHQPAPRRLRHRGDHRVGGDRRRRLRPRVVRGHVDAAQGHQRPRRVAAGRRALRGGHGAAAVVHAVLPAQQDQPVVLHDGEHRVRGRGAGLPVLHRPDHGRDPDPRRGAVREARQPQRPGVLVAGDPGDPPTLAEGPELLRPGRTAGCRSRPDRRSDLRAPRRPAARSGVRRRGRVWLTASATPGSRFST